MSQRKLLDRIHSPADLRDLAPESLRLLAGELRSEILDIVSTHGGHLASNLGTVELTIALLRVFAPPEDKIVWDTSHQAYTYKLLTGRQRLMRRLRLDDGCCGFLHREESDYDAFGAGHAGTAISAALGMAAARDRLGGRERVVAVVGDGALGSGIAFEGLNSIIETTSDFILIINDNRMSIAPNVGAVSRHLNHLLATPSYNRVKGKLADWVSRIPRFGPPLRRLVQRLEEATKSVLVPGVLFEELGLQYIGPLDGHDLGQLLRTLTFIKSVRRPVVIHVLTEKGRGYTYAERKPDQYHSMRAFNLGTGQALTKAPPDRSAITFSASLGSAVCRLAEEDDRIVLITAGMPDGTGLRTFCDTYPERSFDVGIAEEHAVVLAAGMATRGLRPIIAIYASFMQRAMDYVFHDVCLQDLPVILCLDRSGVVNDGPTHHGIQDLGFWLGLPNLAVLQPADGPEQEWMLRLAVKMRHPAIIRYPKGDATALQVDNRLAPQWGKAEVLRDGTDVAIWALGREAALALVAAEELERHGVSATVVNPRFVSPLDRGLLLRQATGGQPIVTIENHGLGTGFGGMVGSYLTCVPGCRLLTRGWPNEVLPWGTEKGIRRKYRMDPASFADDVLAFVRPKD